MYWKNLGRKGKSLDRPSTGIFMTTNFGALGKDTIPEKANLLN